MQAINCRNRFQDTESLPWTLNPYSWEVRLWIASPNNMYISFHFLSPPPTLSFRYDSNGWVREVFETAYSSFLHSLSEDERSLYSPCASAADLEEVKSKGQARFLRTSERFSEKLGPFLRYHQYLYSVKPGVLGYTFEVLCVLVLKLTTNYITFLNKLIKTISRFVDRLTATIWSTSRYYTSHVRHYRHRYHRHGWGAYLERVYVKILQFFQSVARVFFKRCEVAGLQDVCGVGKERKTRLRDIYGLVGIPLTMCESSLKVWVSTKGWIILLKYNVVEKSILICYWSMSLRYQTSQCVFNNCVWVTKLFEIDIKNKKKQ